MAKIKRKCMADRTVLIVIGTPVHSKNVLQKTERKQPNNRKRRRKLSGNSKKESVSPKESAKSNVNSTKPILRRSSRLREFVNMKNNPVDLKNKPPKQKIRRLYSPTQWLLSQQFANLYETS